MTDALTHLFNRLKNEGYGSAQMGGIYANKPGYHNKRDNLPGSDYSVQRADDQQGSGQWASALDVTMNDSDMHRMTQRLIDLTLAGDGRVQVLREFFGTVDGWNVTGLDVRDKRWISSDDSHLWHVHMSAYRRYAGDHAAMDGVATAILGGAGGGVAPPPSGGGGASTRPWPSYMPSGHYFGLITGPNESHGGYYANEQPDVKAIQDTLNAKGYNAGYADGLFEQPTADGVTRFQQAEMPGTQFYGQVWSDDWAKLFS